MFYAYLFKDMFFLLLSLDVYYNKVYAVLLLKCWPIFTITVTIYIFGCLPLPITITPVTFYILQH